ncbi:hypothetical protein HYV12_03055 [Candidatus Dojkabacteria bacterium]|nr:hypothetical protein [Candidatus Dojkabacteria bacterium]
MALPLDVKILNQHEDEELVQIFPKWDTKRFAMSLDEIRSQEDLETWRQHNVEVASYLADIVRNKMFEEGTPAREDFIRGNFPIPKDLKDGLDIWDSISLEIDREEDVHLIFDEELTNDGLNITVYDENHPRVKMLKSLVDGEEIPAEIVNWIADDLGIPMVIHYTAPNAVSTGIGGHAQALARTPYYHEDGYYAYDVVDPMQLKPIIGIKLEAIDLDSAYKELGRKMYSNRIGGHLLDNRAEFNLLEKLSGTPAYDLILNSGTSRLQENDYVNCQFMSLLIQAYLWSYYGSLHDFTQGKIPNVSIGNVIYRRFSEVFNVSLKQLFDVMQKIPQFQVQE